MFLSVVIGMIECQEFVVGDATARATEQSVAVVGDDGQSIPLSLGFVPEPAVGVMAGLAAVAKWDAVAILIEAPWEKLGGQWEDSFAVGT
jgi:hypothetical protein